jgi:hypothetical protein
VLILPPGHWQTVSSPLRLRSRDKWIIGSVLGLVVAGLVALTISLVSTGRTSRNGCVDVTAAAATGGTELYRCGAEARALCSSPGAAGGSDAALQRALAGECRKAGLPLSR